MVRFQNRRNRTRWTSDVFWIIALGNRDPPRPRKDYCGAQYSPGPPSGGKETNYQSGRAASVELYFKTR